VKFNTILAVCFVLYSIQAYAVEPSKDYPVVPLLEGNKTIMGENFSYPLGQPNVTAAILSLTPGTKTISHTHEVPLFIYVLEGEMEVDYGAKGKKTYKNGDAFMEAMSVSHYGVNVSNAPVKVLAVYMGAVGAHDMAPAK
jgi:quercetin dioxygenase-like cupin family protein